MRISLLAASLALACSGAAASAAVIANGSFEAAAVNPGGGFVTLTTGSSAITGWTVTSGTIDYIGGYWQPQDGARSIDLAGNAPGAISQTFTTKAGHGYRIAYWIGRNPDGGDHPRTGFIDVGGGQTQFLYSGAGNRTNMEWQLETFDFVALSSSTTLTFAADPDTASQFYGPALDNVSIGAIPEPATWAMVILGFGVIGGALRRKAVRNTGLHFA